MDFRDFSLQWEMQTEQNRLHWLARKLERVVNALRVIAPELPFEIKFIEITQPEQVIELNGYRITAFKVNHNVLCYGYTLEILRQGKFSAERAKEQESR